MTPRKLSLALVLTLASAAALFAACGGGDDGGDGGAKPGALTDPGSVPTASPWPQPPDVILLDPDNLTPISGGATPAPSEGDGDGEDDGGSQTGDCGNTYEIEAGDSFSLIAEKCGVDLQDLLDANPDVDPATLSIGQVVKIPQ